MKSLKNTSLALIALVFSACGDTTTPTPPDPIQDPDGGVSETPPYVFCGKLYDLQETFRSKMVDCPRLKDPFEGFDVPGFPPNAGYCGETFGVTCAQEYTTLTTMEACINSMPNCDPQGDVRWEEQWRYTCVTAFNESSKSPGCALTER